MDVVSPGTGFTCECPSGSSFEASGNCTSIATTGTTLTTTTTSSTSSPLPSLTFIVPVTVTCIQLTMANYDDVTIYQISQGLYATYGAIIDNIFITGARDDGGLVISAEVRNFRSLDDATAFATRVNSLPANGFNTYLGTVVVVAGTPFESVDLLNSVGTVAPALAIVGLVALLTF